MIKTDFKCVGLPVKISYGGPLLEHFIYRAVIRGKKDSELRVWAICGADKYSQDITLVDGISSVCLPFSVGHADDVFFEIENLIDINDVEITNIRIDPE